MVENFGKTTLGKLYRSRNSTLKNQMKFTWVFCSFRAELSVSYYCCNPKCVLCKAAIDVDELIWHANYVQFYATHVLW